jgi:hypothetical protein
METWMAEYSKQLEIAVKENPMEYTYTQEQVPYVTARMLLAFKGGIYNKDGIAIKRTCKHFGIKHTYTAINHFITNHK